MVILHRIVRNYIHDQNHPVSLHTSTNETPSCISPNNLPHFGTADYINLSDSFISTH